MSVLDGHVVVLPVHVAAAVGGAAADGVAVTPGERDAETDTLAERDAAPEREADGEPETVRDAATERVPIAVTAGVTLPDDGAEPLAVCTLSET